MENSSQNADRLKLIYLLQNAYSGELAAYLAYDGHQKSVRDPGEKLEIQKIRDEEALHRDEVGHMLAELGAAPRPAREFLMKIIGLTIGLLCRIGGWLIPMHGAGKLESGNIVEYEVAARLAEQSGYGHFVNPLLIMAEVEWDHECYFRQKFLSHRLHPLLPMWKIPPPKETIRAKWDTRNK
jgi:demethoxyubiquinone hydroxylase (CLK1/Coq7/Cat5 family)